MERSSPEEKGMETRRPLKRLAAIAALLIAGNAVPLWAQDKIDAPSPGTLAALTAEVRALRIAVEESTKNQTQTQALAVYLSAEQSRLVQVSSRLDAVRTELAAATSRFRELTDSLASAQTRLATVIQPEMRAELEELARAFKQQSDRAADQVRQLTTRESELAQMFQTEEARWADLITRLEQTIKK
jgi:DNA anti-recombination protein RmuC